MTVEAALGITAVVFVLALCLAGIGTVLTQLRCADAAGQAARLAARGDLAAANAAAEALAPAGAVVQIGADGELITATVSAAAVGSLLPGLRVSATAVSAREEAVPP